MLIMMWWWYDDDAGVDDDNDDDVGEDNFNDFIWLIMMMAIYRFKIFLLKLKLLN